MIDWVFTAVRAIGFVAIFQAVGMAIFLSALGHSTSAATRDWIRKAAVGWAAAAIGLLLVLYLLEPARMGGTLASIGDPSLQQLVRSSPITVALAWRLLGLMLICLGTALGTSAGGTAAILGAGLTLAGFAQIGHTSIGPWRPLLGPLLWLHLAVVAFWFASLPLLFRIAGNEAAPAAGIIVAQFSRIATWLVPGLFAAGFTMAAILIGDLQRLFTAYGSVIAGKTTIFAVLMAAAALNKWRYGPALERGDSSAARSLRRSIAVEIGLITTALILTAVLTTFLSPES